MLPERRDRLIVDVQRRAEALRARRNRKRAGAGMLAVLLLVGAPVALGALGDEGSTTLATDDSPRGSSEDSPEGKATSTTLNGGPPTTSPTQPSFPPTTGPGVDSSEVAGPTTSALPPPPPTTTPPAFPTTTPPTNPPGPPSTEPPPADSSLTVVDRFFGAVLAGDQDTAFNSWVDGGQGYRSSIEELLSARNRIEVSTNADEQGEQVQVQVTVTSGAPLRFTPACAFGAVTTLTPDGRRLQWFTSCPLPPAP